MTKKLKGFRASPATVRKLAELKALYGTEAEAIAVAIARLHFIEIELIGDIDADLNTVK